jgi:hypothetical protein
MLFFRRFREGALSVDLYRKEFASACEELGISPPKNLGDIVYSFRYRSDLPERVVRAAPKDRSWIIMPAGHGLYRLEAVRNARLHPSTNRSVVKILDATPGIIAANAQSDEQALLAKLRYNRLIDTFLRITCYSLQNHMRTTVEGMGQIEIDEVYLGVDRGGAQYIIPVQAKGGKDVHSAVQIRQDVALCEMRFKQFVCRPVGAQFIGDVIALMEFRLEDGEIVVRNEQHYRLVQPGDLSQSEVASYRASTDCAD